MEFPRRAGPWRAQPSSLTTTTTAPGTIETLQAVYKREIDEIFEFKYPQLSRDDRIAFYDQAIEDLYKEPDDPNETALACTARLQKVVKDFDSRLYKHCVDNNLNDVVGGLQEERQPGNDPGNDENGPRGEDIGPRLRGRGTV